MRLPKLRDKPYGVSRDYPTEIVKERQSLWSQFKSTLTIIRIKVSFGCPAKISIDGNFCVIDLFPEWYDVLQGSRISCNPQPRNIVYAAV